LKAVILAAGYGIRLYPLTKNRPKGLLKIGERAIIEYVIEKINETNVNEIIIVSNHKFFEIFNEWNDSFENKIPIRVVDDGSTTNENRIGAINDILIGIENIDDDLLVIASDNIIEFNLKSMQAMFNETTNNIIAVFDVKDKDKVRGKHGVALIKDGKVVGFQEKPEEPESTMKSICCYMFKKEIGELLQKYLNENNKDAPGFFIEWLSKEEEVYAFEFNEEVHNIGDVESYNETNELFSK